ALLLSNGAGFQNAWMTGDPAQNRNWVGGWHLGGNDRVVVGDFNGDGKADLFIRSDDWTGVLSSTGAGFRADVVQQHRVNAWLMNYLDQVLVGRFNGTIRDEVFFAHPGGWRGVVTPSGAPGGAVEAITLTKAWFEETW